MSSNSSRALMVGGLQPLTLIDFPGRLASVVFAQGCNLRCRFCYNCGLLAETSHDLLSWSSIIDFFRDRQGFIEGVVFSGGEPCMQSSLLDAMRQIRKMGFEVALHTNGYYPNVIEKALNERLLQFVAVDFKAPPERYFDLTGQPVDSVSFGRLADLLVDAGVKYEYRTTVHPLLLSDSDVMRMADWLCERKVGSYAIQKFKHGQALDSTLRAVVDACLQPATVMKLRARFTSFSLRTHDEDGDQFSKAA